MIFSLQARQAVGLAVIVFTALISGEAKASSGAESHDLALLSGVTRQYHIAPTPVSPAVLQPVSAVDSSLDSRSDLIAERALESGRDRDSRAEQAQYHQQMRVRIGLVLAAVYVVFLGCWFWATRVRPGRR